MPAKGRTRDLDHAIAALAGRQHGVVARFQLVRIGLGSSAIGERVAAGKLHRLRAGVYAVGHMALTRRSHWMAAVLACAPGAVLSHRSAAALWGLLGTGGGRIDVTSARKTKSRGSIRRHYAHLPADEVTVREGIPVTTVPRTIFDLAARSPHLVESALRQAEFHRLYDTLSLVDLVDRYPGHRGIRAARDALDRRAETPGETASPLEDVFLPFLDRHRLPRPHLNAWLTVAGRRYKVDCLWPRRGQIVELDSWQAHGTRTAFREDKARDRRLGVHGYSVTRLTWAQLADEPEAVAADLRSLLT